MIQPHLSQHRFSFSHSRRARPSRGAIEVVPQADTLASIERHTRGNFRLLERLLDQAQRVLDINDLDTITTDVIHTAREAVVIGST